MDKKYLITVVAKDGKTKLETFQEFSDGKFDSLYTIADKCIKKDGVYNATVNGQNYGIHAYVYDGDVTLDSTTTLGDANDVATSLTSYNAKNMVLLKVNGNLTINSYLTAFSNSYGGPKGFYIFCTGTLTNNSTISMNAKGANANGQDVYLYKNSNGSYEYVPANGAGGGGGGSYYKIHLTIMCILLEQALTVLAEELAAVDGGGAYTPNYSRGGSGSSGISYGGGCGGGGTRTSGSTNVYRKFWWTYCWW